MTTNVPLPNCHGCLGRGLVDGSKGVQVCPLCFGSGVETTYPRPIVTWGGGTTYHEFQGVIYNQCTHPSSMACCATGH